MIKRRTEDKVIDGLLVVTTQYSLRESLQLQAVLAKLVLPVLAKVEGASVVGVMRGDVGKLSAALMQAAEQLHEDQLWPLVRRILACTEVEVTDDRGPRRVWLNTDATIEANIGELGTLYKVLGFVLVMNFKRSFTAASTALPATGPDSQASPTPASE